MSKIYIRKREQVQAKLRIVNRAIAMNRADLDKAKSEKSRQVTEAAKPEYVGIVSGNQEVFHRAQGGTGEGSKPSATGSISPAEAWAAASCNRWASALALLIGG